MEQFSLLFKALKLQVESLFDDVGSDKALALLDAIAKTPDSQREKIIDAMISTVKKFESSEHIEDPEFVESLVSSITSELKSPRFSVIRGGNKTNCLTPKKQNVIKVLQ